MDLTPNNVGDWLGTPAVEVTELGGGVSNTVLLAGEVVVKQSLGRLRVEQTWLSDRSRVLREAAAMRWLSGRVRGGRIPQVLREDHANYALAMEAAPYGAEMWKTQLMRGQIDIATARSAGTFLGSMISASWDNPDAREIFGDQTVFGQLRLDPYYRSIAEHHPSVVSYVESLPARRVSLVHGDFSPKNLLVADGEIWVIDWEVIHFGDPSFDVAFLWNHLLLKAIAGFTKQTQSAELAVGFTEALRGELQNKPQSVIEAALLHLPALLLARVDGKSPAEYLDSGMGQRARKLAFDLIARPAGSIEEVFGR